MEEAKCVKFRTVGGWSEVFDPPSTIIALEVNFELWRFGGYCGFCDMVWLE